MYQTAHHQAANPAIGELAYKANYHTALKSTAQIATRVKNRYSRLSTLFLATTAGFKLELLHSSSCISVILRNPVSKQCRVVFLHLWFIKRCCMYLRSYCVDWQCD
jgi:hypothetical protein